MSHFRFVVFFPAILRSHCFPSDKRIHSGIFLSFVITKMDPYIPDVVILLLAVNVERPEPARAPLTGNEYISSLLLL